MPLLRTSRAPPTGPRASAPLFQQAVSGISAPKRQRSPSGDVPSRKAPRTSDLPDRPRAMREESSSHNGPSRIPTHESVNRSNPRSLLERVGSTPAYQHPNGHIQHQPPFDPIQSQIDAVTRGAMVMNPNAQAFIPGQGPMNGINNLANPMAIQEMLSTQMAMMTQMAMQLGVNPMGVPMNPANGFTGPVQAPLQMNSGFGGRGRGRGGFRGGRPGPPQLSGHRGNPDTQAQDSVADTTPTALTQTSPDAAPIAAPTSKSPTVPAPAAVAPQNAQYPERPGTPTLCKFGVNCTHPTCRYSHPSPAATAESGLVLSKEPCGNGVKCEDKDCTKAHPSKSQLDPNGKRQPSLLAAWCEILTTFCSRGPGHATPCHTTFQITRLSPIFTAYPSVHLCYPLSLWFWLYPCDMSVPAPYRSNDTSGRVSSWLETNRSDYITESRSGEGEDGCCCHCESLQ